jgi:hypothetical protein
MTSGVTGRIELRQSARVTLGRETAQLSVADLQLESSHSEMANAAFTLPRMQRRETVHRTFR